MVGLGERIREIRKQAGLTQPQFAEALGVSNAIISFWENDINEPTATNIRNIVVIFHVSPTYLLGLCEY